VQGRLLLWKSFAGATAGREGVLTRVGRVPTEAVGKAELSELGSLFFLA
jgi:hypothetical protein